MKSLLGAGALVLAMGLGAWSSDALPRDDEPREQGRHQRQDAPDDQARQVSGQDKADKADKTDKKPHPLGGPPGLEQRDRNGPPPWSGGPEKRSEEPPGLANKGAHAGPKS